MNIPEYSQRVRPPSFRKPLSTAKAEGELAKARRYQYQAGVVSGVLGLGEGALRVADKILEYQEANELMNAETEVRKRMDDFSERLRDPENPISFSEYGDLWKEERESIYADVFETLKLRGAKEEFAKRYERMANDFGFDVQTKAWKQQVNKMKADTLVDVEEAIKHNDYFKVKEYLTAASGYVFTPVEVESLLKDARERIAYGLAKKEAYGRGFEPGIQFINSSEMNAILKEKGLTPSDFTDQDRGGLERRLRVDFNLEQSRIEREHQERRTEQNLNLGDMYVKNTLTMEFLAEETKPGGALADIEGSDYTKWINMLEAKPKGMTEEEKTKWEVTDPNIEAKVAKYVRRTDRTPEQKAGYVAKYHGVGLSTDDYNKYMDKTGFPEKKKEVVGKNPNEETNPELMAAIVRDIANREKDIPETDRKIAENIGADADGNPRLSPTDARTLLNWNRSYKDNSAFQTASKMFEKAFDDGLLTSKQMVDGMREFEIKVASGDYTPAGLIQEAENMIALINEEYISKKLERPKWYKKKETVEEYVERHPPEMKPIPLGGSRDFRQWKNIDINKKIHRVSFDVGDVFSEDGITWYMKYNDIWYIVDPKTGGMTQTWKPK